MQFVNMFVENFKRLELSFYTFWEYISFSKWNGRNDTKSQEVEKRMNITELLW